MKCMCGSCWPTYPIFNPTLNIKMVFGEKYLEWALFQILSLFSLLNVITKFNNFPTFPEFSLGFENRSPRALFAKKWESHNTK